MFSILTMTLKAKLRLNAYKRLPSDYMLRISDDNCTTTERLYTKATARSNQVLMSRKIANLWRLFEKTITSKVVCAARFMTACF